MGLPTIHIIDDREMEFICLKDHCHHYNIKNEIIHYDSLKLAVQIEFKEGDIVLCDMNLIEPLEDVFDFCKALTYVQPKPFICLYTSLIVFDYFNIPCRYIDLLATKFIKSFKAEVLMKIMEKDPRYSVTQEGIEFDAIDN